jgi:type I restriction enzyme M protein
MLEKDLKSKVGLLWDRFWSGGISDPLQAITQISYLIFMKRLEDEDSNRKQNSLLSGEKYVSIFDGVLDYQGRKIDRNNCRWSVWTEYPASKILDHVQDNVFPFLKSIDGGDSLYAQYMKDAVFTIPTASLLIEAVKIINGMHIKEQNRDTKGDLYEYLLSELKTSGKNGQFRTPRHIIKMMVAVIDPQFGERICDPACGTAGFLVTAYEHILKENTSPDLIKKDDEGNEYNFVGDKLDTNQWNVLREETFYGFDFDQTMSRISLMNMMMHGINKPNIKQINTLSTRYGELNCYDVVLANPPFKGSIDPSELSENFRIKNKKTELLFLELMYNILRNSGRCAVIVPDGVLFGSSNAHRAVRQLLLEKCRLDAVISMPSGVFKPYAGVSTGVLIFTKGEPTKEVWFYDMESDGYSLDDKRTPTEKNDIPDIIAKYAQKDNVRYTDRKAKCFTVPIKEIKDNDFDLSINRYKEIEYEEVSHEKPEKIIEKILEKEREITKELEELKKEL